ncbi:dethiobiotin synthase [uncultured Paraglaciecola sp.]|uniref:dethiobiotin synthase n=1 Tax=uncultured Paraglaciecola sp. TaxID=1765024 RepID=UPI0030DA2CA7|tara:strand:- start:129 stop:914 length:786 start_codon:yes stop_codon:yes gene_type:complete
MGHLSVKRRAFFVTGTDTEVGKTFVSEALLILLNKKGLLTCGYKPIAAGCERTPEGLRNEDALALQQHSSIDLHYDEVNPIAFEAAIAPHLAAQNLSADTTSQPISIDTVREGFNCIFQKHPDVIIVEGAGGWRLPLGIDYEGQPRYLSEFVVEQNLSVILVVGMRLGCLNHAVLTAECIRNDGLKIAGWVANQMEPDMPYLDENVDSLKSLLDAPFLGLVPRVNTAEQASAYLDLSAIDIINSEKGSFDLFGLMVKSDFV